MKMMQGAFFLPCSKRSRTRDAPTPTNISTKVRTGDGEERDVGFAGNCAGEQGLAGSGRSDEQNALGDATAKALELLGLAEKLNNFLELFLGFIDAGDVL